MLPIHLPTTFLSTTHRPTHLPTDPPTPLPPYPVISQLLDRAARECGFKWELVGGFKRRGVDGGGHDLDYILVRDPEMASRPECKVSLY